MFDSLRGMAGMASLMKDLPKIKAKLEQVKAEVSVREVEATAGNGAVTVVANGKMRVVRLEVDHAALSVFTGGGSTDDVDLVAGLVIEATNAALDKAQEMISQAIQAAGRDLGLPIPQGALEGLL